MEISSTLQDQFADAIVTAVGATGFARFYDDGAFTTLLASASCNNPIAPAAATGVITLNVTPAVEDTTPAAAGTCTRLGFYTSTAATSGAFIFMLGVNTTGTPDVTMSNNIIATTDTVQISSLTITVPTGSPTV